MKLRQLFELKKKNKPKANDKSTVVSDGSYPYPTNLSRNIIWLIWLTMWQKTRGKSGGFFDF